MADRYDRARGCTKKYEHKERGPKRYRYQERYEEMPRRMARGNHLWNNKSNLGGQKQQQKQRRRRIIGKFCALVVELALCLVLIAVVNSVWKNSNQSENASLWSGMAAGEEDIAKANADKVSSEIRNLYPDLDLEGYPENLIKLLELNEEALDYVKSYPDREQYQNQPIDLSQDIQSGEVPLLMQWDRRWGYDAYGDDMIGLSGCGPVCLTMAYLYLTEDTGMTPREMAEFAYTHGYYAEGGTSWSLWTEGAAQLGLSGQELPLDENRMRQALDGDGLIVCSMRPGDFTTTGHFILIRGYDEKGFYVNDPNRRSNSEKQWDFDTLRYQIKNLWVLQQ